MTEQPRVTKGVPTGGRFAATAHGEAPVALEPAVHENGETTIRDAVRGTEDKVRQLKRELDRIHLQGAVEALRRAYPTAVELRANYARDYRGNHIEGLQPVRLLDADGRDATGGNEHWIYEGSPEHGMSPAYHLGQCLRAHLDEPDLIGEDEQALEYVIRLDRDYWKDSAS